ncbi:hypothetical protein [Novosphingobium sp. PY1]|uniref:Uncharacterized protein n=1 Tax=Ochrobactrum sp. PW1 TaxID=1882222 RepID=A0A292GS73_9HYPH|nr:hypothetical protein [Novosphingobium sp. PY1]BBA74306.1 hypothetical protein [Ochrobactrum sp. PW1]GFM29155.1 uncharacterized protein PY1_contig-07-81 [Novosphingobium sp. PY1]
MKGSQIWDVDRIIAAKVLSELGVEASRDKIEAVARHAATHREDSAYWAAKRVQTANLERLAEQLRSDYREHQSVWYDGFRAAEACIATTTADEALQMASTPPQSIAGIIRSRIRLSKAENRQNSSPT